MVSVNIKSVDFGDHVHIVDSSSWTKLQKVCISLTPAIKRRGLQ